MDAWLKPYRQDAEHALKEGRVRDIDFADSTYLVEVEDPQSGEIFWPFLQFDEGDKLKDAFCSCSSEQEHCLHAAIAYFSLFDAEHRPLHLRFQNSFWNKLCMLIADHCGYADAALQKTEAGFSVHQNGVEFSIRGEASALSPLLMARPKATPETSIKFSNLSQEEITRWKEGRPSPTVRYLLSVWFDLAKWLLKQSGKESVVFQEDESGLPTSFEAVFPTFSIHCRLARDDLEQLLPFLDSINSSLRLFQAAEEKIQSLRFDPQNKRFLIEHFSAKEMTQKNTARSVGDWFYLPNSGFYPKKGNSILGRDEIVGELVPEFLETCQELISKFIPIDPEPRSLRYTLHFDDEWNWHFGAYLFEKNDLLEKKACLLEGWIYLPTQGFFAVKDVLFDTAEKSLVSSEVAHFVNHHRIWLNGQEGYQTHLASIESQLGYSLKEDNQLVFHPKSSRGSVDSMDFGDWMFYKGQGFFSKKHARLGLIVKPGLEVAPEEISRFIKSNSEELESLPHFFASVLPIQSRGLEIKVKSSTSLEIKPVYTLKPEYKEATVQFFDEFVYIEELGFCELPAQMRLPVEYSKKTLIGSGKLAHFLETELPALNKFILKLDPKMHVPQKTDLRMDYLVRTADGGLKTQIFYQTEKGKIAVTELLETLEQKKRFYFSSEGMLDLHASDFQWLHGFKSPYQKQAQTIELSTMDFIRLDASMGLLGPLEESAAGQITRRLMQELRDFSTHEAPDTTGLKSTLRLYQQMGLQWLFFLYKNGLSGLLCDDMGLGKTHQAMALIAATLNQKKEEKKRYLVVCPTSVIYHWQDKLETFLPKMKVHTFHGLKRTLKRLPKESVLLTTYGVLRMEAQALQKIPFELAIYDEVQVAKNAHSRVHAALQHIQAKMHLGLTGTPIENSLLELKSLFDLVLPGYLPGTTKFRELFVNPIERDFDEEKKALLTQLIRPFTLRRRKTEVLQELPEKSEDHTFCELSKEQSTLYQNALDQAREGLIAGLKDQETKVNYIHVFSLLSQLKQICNHPALVHKDPKNFEKYASGKWDLFVQLLEEARDSEQKVVVFSQYLYMLDIMENYLKKRGWGYAQIRGDTVDRREELRRFQEDPECVIFIGSLQAAGLGIDLTSASVVIMYDRWWNAARENQAIDRVHRMGQKWAVQVYKLITKNTIEEKIDRMIFRKGRLLEEVVKADAQAVLKKFTRSELIDLLTFSNTD
ncbi:MAG: hypothetical protein S4CHLAM123_05810 [Chlamydiales bacterium]|nr:hypothetical protein [Chlamydiales bacterium]